MRLDVFLAEKFPEISRAIFQKLIANSRVEINGQKAKNSAQEIRENDDVKVHFPHALSFENEIKNFEKNLVFENKNVVVINKPAGILTHQKGGIEDEFTVADFVKSRIRKDKNDDDIFAKTNRAGIVHRLDRATSGILIAAKNAENSTFLSRQFQDRKAHKIYLALVENAPKNPAAKIDLPIARNAKIPSEFRVDAKGKSAITNYETLEIFADNSALLALRPLTGRTHQLRVHLSYIGAPILGDAIYNENFAKKLRKNLAKNAKNFIENAEKNSAKNDLKNANFKNEKRMFLHAFSLEITIKNDENLSERKTFFADLPDDFRAEILAKNPDFDFEKMQKKLVKNYEKNDENVEKESENLAQKKSEKFKKNDENFAQKNLENDEKNLGNRAKKFDENRAKNLKNNSKKGK